MKGIPELMPFIPCNLHVAHNAYRRVCRHMDHKLKNLPLKSSITFDISHADEMISQRSKKKLDPQSKCQAHTEYMANI